MFKIKPYKARYIGNKSWQNAPLSHKAKLEWSSFKRHVKNEKSRIIDEIGMAWNRAIARVKNEYLFWTYEDPWGEEQDLECSSFSAALDNAQEWFNDHCNDSVESPANGQEEETDIIVFQFFYDQKTGERRITRKSFETLSWEYYHGDLKEHGTWGM